MESKGIEEYFSKAKQLPIAVSIADIKSIISAKGVTSPPKKSWWNLNNIIIMTTTTLLTATILFFTLSEESSKELAYVPNEYSFSSKTIDEPRNERMLFVVLEEDSTEKKNIGESLFQGTPSKEVQETSEQKGNPEPSTLFTEKSDSPENIFAINSKSGLVEAPELFEDDTESEAIEEVEKQIFDMETATEEELFDSGIELTEQVEGETKKVTQERDVNELSTLVLKNRNGNITVNTWEEPKIKVIAFFTLETKEPEDAKVGFNDFKINILEQGGKAVVESNWDELNNCSCNASSGNTRPLKGIGKLLYFPSKNKAQTDDGVDFQYEKFKIEYLVYIPRDFNVDLKNQYADIHLAPINGDANINVFHGNLEAKTLGDLSLQSKYGKAELGAVKDAEVVLFHSDTKIGTSNEMDLTAKYSTVEIGGLKELNLEGFQSKLKVEGPVKEEIEGSFKYGDLILEGDVKELEISVFQAKVEAENIEELNLNASYSKLKANRVNDLELEKAFQTNFKIEELGEVEGALKYSPMNIGSLEKSLDLKTFQGNVAIKEVQAGFKSMQLDTKYTNIDLKFNTAAKYDLDVETTYTDLKLPAGVTNTSEEESLNGSQNHFVGTFNKESSKEASKIFMKSFQGHVTFY